MDLDIIFIGTAGSAPTARRGLPATLVRRGGDRLLFDCGEGTQRQMLRSVGLLDLEQIFLTHFHADHFLGLPGMLKTFGLRGRETPLTVYGPPGLQKHFLSFKPVIGRTAFPLHLVELEPNQSLARDGYSVTAFRVEHSVLAYGYALVEDQRPGRFDEQRALELGVEPGPDFGRLQSGESVNGVKPSQVLGEPRRGRKLVIVGDTAPCATTRVAAHEADLLIHEASFMQEERQRAVETGHSTAHEVAELAREAEAKLLALVHVSTRYAGAELRDEARAVFPNTIVPHDFDRIEIPFPERGDPEHHKAPKEEIRANSE